MMHTPPPRRRPVEAMIFDLDGTLLDSAPQIAVALNMMLRSEGYEPLSVREVAQHVGWGSSRLIETAWAAHGCILSPEQIAIRESRYLANYEDIARREACLFPDVEATLRALAAQGVALGVCTNKPEQISRVILERAGLAELFQVIVGGDSGFGLKPSPNPLDAARRKLGKTSPRTLFVGDNHIDIACGRAAGIPVAIITREGAPAYSFKHAPDRTLLDLSELIGLCAAGETGKTHAVGAGL